MEKSGDGQWHCLFCGKAAKVKTNIFEHIEATHVQSPGYSCEFCILHETMQNKECFKGSQTQRAQ